MIKGFHVWLSESDYRRMKRYADMKGMEMGDYAAYRMGCRPGVRKVYQEDANKVKMITPFEPGKEGSFFSFKHGVHTHRFNNVFRHSVRGGHILYTLREYPDGKSFGRNDRPHQLHVFDKNGYWMVTIRSGQGFGYHIDEFVDIVEKYSHVPPKVRGKGRRKSTNEAEQEDTLEMGHNWYKPDNIRVTGFKDE